MKNFIYDFIFAVGATTIFLATLWFAGRIAHEYRKLKKEDKL